MMNRRSTGNGLPSDEQVINIVVIKDPSDWAGGSVANFPPSQGQCQSSGRQFLSHSEKRPSVTSHPHLYKSQSFTVGIPPDLPSLPWQAFDQNSPHMNRFTPSGFTNSSFNQTTSFGAAQPANRAIVTTGGSYDYIQQSANSLTPGQREFAKGPTSAFQTKAVDMSKTRLLRHRSVTLPLEGSMVTLDRSSMYNNISSTASQPCSPNFASPATSSSCKGGQDTFFSSPVATTPDSGFCTPSMLSAPFQALLSSTPTVASECPGMNSTEVGNCSSVTGEKSPDSIFDNSIDWNENDSAVDEEGDSPLNSSLRSVNWLKTFPIGDSVLNISPPMPSSSPLCHAVSQDCNTYQDIQKSSSTNQVRENFVSALPSETRVQAKPLPQRSSSSSFPSISTPFPIFMPAIMQNRSVLAASQCGGVAVSQGSNRPALGELKLNKREKLTKRTKNNGHFFTRPAYSYADLIKLAIKSCESGKMTLREIIAWIEDHFPFFKHEAKPNWTSTLKQSLSQHSDFMKVDEKPKRKWSLCSTASHQHLKPVMKPPEIPSHVLESLNRSKRNVLQPILPKLSAYALVPIQNLALDAVPPSNSIGAVQANPTALHLSQQQQQQKLIHILPNPQHHHLQSLPSQTTPVTHHIPPITTPRLATWRRSKSSNLEPKPAGGCGTGRNLETKTAVSSRSRRKKTATVSVTDQNGQNRQHLSSLLPPNPDRSQSDKEMSDERKQKTFRLSKQPNFPLDTVVDIQEEKGSRPGEKKIIFVLKDNSQSEPVSNRNTQSLPQQLAVRKMPDGRAETNRSCDQTPLKRKVSKTVTDKFRADPKKKMCFSKKTGPVMNLRHILENYQEDKTAAETIGRMLSEEDSKTGRAQAEPKWTLESRRFTHLTSCSKQTDSSRMLSEEDNKTGRAQAEPKWTLESRHFTHLKSCSKQTDSIAKQPICPLEDDLSPEIHNVQLIDMESQRRTEKVSSCSTKPLPAVSKKTNIIRRVNIMKSNNIPHAKSPTACTGSYPVGTEKCESVVSSSKPTIPRTISDERPLSSHSCASLKSSTIACSRNIPSSVQTCGGAGNSNIPRPTFYRTKSRRKQIHVPLKSEISPDRNCDSFQRIAKQDPKFVSKPPPSSYVSSMPAADTVTGPGSHGLPHFLTSPFPRSAFDEHNNSANGFSSSSSDVENPPSLHFLSTFSKTPDSSSSSNKENVGHSRHNLVCQPSYTVKTMCSSDHQGNDPSPQLRQDTQPGQLSNPALASSNLRPSHPINSSNVPTDNLPSSMSTPPCGNLLRPSSSAMTSTAGTISSNLLLPARSPSISPSTLRQLNPRFLSTPPPAMAPLSMSTPTHPSSRGVSAGQTTTDVFDISPLPGNITGMLDTSFLDHLETLIADLHPQQLSCGNGGLPSYNPDS